MDSIRLLFSAIGYLKNHGVLSQEFEWPDQAELFPIFHGEMTAERERRYLESTFSLLTFLILFPLESNEGRRGEGSKLSKMQSRKLSCVH